MVDLLYTISRPHRYHFQCRPIITQQLLSSLRWRHNELDGVSDHQSHDCLLNCLFGRRSKKTSKLRVTGHLCGEFTGPQWISRTKAFCILCFHLMTSSCIAIQQTPGRFKNVYKVVNPRVVKFSILNKPVSFNVWVRYFVWFKISYRYTERCVVYW